MPRSFPWIASATRRSSRSRNFAATGTSRSRRFEPRVWQALLRPATLAMSCQSRNWFRPDTPEIKTSERRGRQRAGAGPGSVQGPSNHEMIADPSRYPSEYNVDGPFGREHTRGEARPHQVLKPATRQVNETQRANTR